MYKRQTQRDAMYLNIQWKNEAFYILNNFPRGRGRGIGSCFLLASMIRTDSSAPILSFNHRASNKKEKNAHYIAAANTVQVKNNMEHL